MTVLFYENSEGEQSLETTEWTEFFSKSGFLRAQENFIFLSAEYTSNGTNRPVGLRVLLNGVERSFSHASPAVAGQYMKFTDFGIFTPTVEGVNTLSVQVRGLNAGTIVSVRRIRLMVRQS